ncbi:MAG: 23S rRNA (uracil(1939)-C(5))-methyltransferase RlmD [Saprospiraceae bacterium]
MARKKKPYKNLQIVGIADKGKAVGKTPEGQVIFVEGAVPGDVVDVLILRKKKNYSEAVTTNMVTLSPFRVTPDCEHFGTCGGCKWQNLDYQEQLLHKEKTVVDAVQRLAKLPAEIVKPIVGCDTVFRYRNKLEYSFSTKRWLTSEEIALSEEKIAGIGALGFHKAGYFDKVVDIKTCHLQESLTNSIRNFIRDFAYSHGLSYYDVKAHIGFLRNIIIRNTKSGDWMVILVVGSENEKDLHPLLDAIQYQFPEIKSLYYVINPKHNDTIFDLEHHLWYGEPYILETLGNVRYKIGSKSFFQTNPLQAETLFNIAVKYAECTPNDIVYDLYTGLGSIALYIAADVHKVIGIEEVPEAIDDAKENALLNDIQNVKFFAGDVKDLLTDDFIKLHKKPDIIITDPPRAGMHESVVETLLKVEARRIVYISCNPSTQARDLALLSQKYTVDDITPVDMFPHTHHIESVAKLTLKTQ